MAKVIANLTLDTYRRNRILPLIVPQGDYGAREVHARITSNGNFVKFKKTDAVSIIATRTKDGESLAFSGTINDDDSVNVPITQWMLDSPSCEVKCHIEITGNGYKYSTNEFLIEPQEKANPTEITEDDPRIDVVTEVLLNENARQVNENLRIDAENLRNSAEEQRLIDEEKRIENETQRISAENYRDTTFKNWSSEIALLPNMSDRISRNDKRITNLEHGLPDDNFITDFSVAYVKDVPSNALPYAEVKTVCGMTYRNGDTLKSAKTTEIKSVGANLSDIETLLIPDAVQALDGYGDGINNAYLNVVDFNNRKYIRWVRRLSDSEKVLIPAIEFIYDNIVYYQLPKTGTADEGKTANNILVSNFEVYKGSQGWDSADRIGTVTGMATYGAYWFGFAKGTTFEEAQAVIDQSDILVTSQFAEIIDISDILSVDNYIEVESGGTITAVNEYGLAVPSEITYQIEEATV